MRFEMGRHFIEKWTFPGGMRSTLVVIECHGASGMKLIGKRQRYDGRQEVYPDAEATQSAILRS